MLKSVMVEYERRLATHSQLVSNFGRTISGNDSSDLGRTISGNEETLSDASVRYEYTIFINCTNLEIADLVIHLGIVFLINVLYLELVYKLHVF